MFGLPEKYKKNGHFFLKKGQKLEDACNAPSDKKGVYLVYMLKNGSIDMVFIGRSLDITPESSGSLKEGILEGGPGRIPQKTSWPKKLITEGIDALDVYWFVTESPKLDDDPASVEKKTLKKHYEIYGRLPDWNK